MPTIIKFRRGTTAQNNSFTGSLGEISFDTEIKTLRVHDSATAGGFELVNTNQVQTISNKTIGSNLLPSVDSAYDLGSASFKWKDLYLSGNSIFLGSATITSTGSSVNLPAGSTINGVTVAALDSAGIRGLFSAAGDLTYNASTGEFTFDVENVYTQANFDSDFNTSLDAAALGGSGLAYDTATNTLSIDSAELAAFALPIRTLFSAAGDLSYDSATGVFSFDVENVYTKANFDSDLGLAFSTSAVTTTNLAEGTNLYYTSARVDSDFDARLATKTTANLTEGTNLYYTSARADSDAKRAISAGVGISYTASTGVIATNDSAIVHDNLSGFVANEHVDHSTVTITAGTGLSGGGDLTASRTLTVVGAVGIKVGADGVSIDSSEVVNYAAPIRALFSGTTGISYDLNAGTIAIDSAEIVNYALPIRALFSGGTGITYSSSTGSIATNDGAIVHDNLSGFVSNEHIDHSTVSIVAGRGLSGGGDLTTSKTIDIDSAEFAAAFKTTNLPEGINLYYTKARVDSDFDARLATKTTANLTEGTNLYYTSARADSDAKHAISGGTGVTYTASTGVIEIGQAVDSTSNVVFNSLTTTDGLIVGGNLQVLGSTTTVSSQDLKVTDNMIYMNDGESAGSPTAFIDIGFAGNYNDIGSYAHAGLFRDATDGRWKFFQGYTLEPDSGVEINTGHASFALAPVQVSAVFANTLTGHYLGFDSDFSEKSTTNLTEGTNLYYTSARADSDAKRAVSAGTGITYTASTGVIATNDGAIVHDNLSGFVANEHVDHSGVTLTAGNGLTGGGDITASRSFAVGAGVGIKVGSDDVSIDSAEIVNYASPIRALFSGGTGITYSSTTGAISTNDGAIVHDNLSGFVANEHVDHSTVTLTAGDGLTGGGTIAASRTFAVGAGVGIKVGTDDVSIDSAEIVNYASPIRALFVGGDGLTLTGGTFAVGAGVGIKVATDTVAVDSSGLATYYSKVILHDNTNGFVSDEHIAHSGVTLTAGNGLTGGGTIAASRSFAVGAGSYIIVNADDVAVDATSANTASKVVARDASGNFSAGTITATLSGNASTATTWETGRTISLSGDITGTSGTFNGSANLSFATEIAANVVGANELNVSGNGTAGQALLSDGDGSFSWGDAGATITDDTTTNDTRYLLWDDVTSGSATSVGVSSTKLYFNPSTGDLSATNFNSLSDITKKKDISTITNAIEKVDALRGVDFRWKETDKKAIGLIAQEVEHVIPEVVVEANNVKSVNYDAIIGLLVEAIKDLKKKVDNLEQQTVN